MSGWRTPLFTAAGAALLLSSCGGGRPPSESAEQIVASIELVELGVESTNRVVENSCVVETLRDEYGFLVDVQSCDIPADKGDQAIAPSDLSTWLGSPDAAGLVSLVRDISITGDCTASTHDAELISQLAERHDLLQRSADPSVATLGQLVGQLHSALDRLQGACVFGERAWAETAPEATAALRNINDFLDSPDAIG